MGDLRHLPPPPRKHSCCDVSKRIELVRNDSRGWELHAPMPPGTQPMGFALVPATFCPWCGVELDAEVARTDKLEKLWDGIANTIVKGFEKGMAAERESKEPDTKDD